MGNGWEFFGKNLIMVGIIFILIGGFFLFKNKIPWLGHLPGDIIIKKGNFGFYFPIATCILLSIILSIIFSLWRK